jgi:hypothetical protein
VAARPGPSGNGTWGWLVIIFPRRRNETEQGREDLRCRTAQGGTAALISAIECSLTIEYGL